MVGICRPMFSLKNTLGAAIVSVFAHDVSFYAKSHFVFPPMELMFGNPINSARGITYRLNANVTFRRNLTHQISYHRARGRLNRLRMISSLIRHLEFPPKSPYNDASPVPFKIRFISATTPIEIYRLRKKNYSLFHASMPPI